MHGTILVSKLPFSAEEMRRITAICAAEGIHLVFSPDRTPQDAVIDQLLDLDTVADAVASSNFDFPPPTDMKPYFFLQVRPRDFLSFVDKDAEDELEITFRAVRVMVVLCALAIGLTLLLLVLSFVTQPAREATPLQRRMYRGMSFYFAGIGVGYILIQLGMHQRLILILGNPTTALSVVLFSMLLGTGIGSAFSKRLFVRPGSFAVAWLAILVTLAILIVALPALSIVERVPSAIGRETIVRLIMGAMGFVLGFGFPLGVRLVAPSGEWSVQRMWAINGAASIAGSALAPILGVTLGCRATLTAGFCFYALVTVCGMWALRFGLRSARSELESSKSSAV